MKTPGPPKKCFVIAPIGVVGSTTRRKSDQVFKHIISNAITPLGYKAVRADHIQEPGIITSQIIQEIVDAPLVIADLSERNPNVFYELAIRHVTRKPLISMISSGEPIPFDVQATRIIQYDLSDLDTVDQAREAIAKQVESMMEENYTPYDNPVSSALELKLLKESKNPEQRSIAEVMQAISDLRNQVNLLSRPKSSQEDEMIQSKRRMLKDLYEKRAYATAELKEVKSRLGAAGEKTSDKEYERLRYRESSLDEYLNGLNATIIELVEELDAYH